MTCQDSDRRRLLLAGALVCASPAARAQQAAKFVKLLVGFPPGQATDTVARLLAERLRGATGTNHVVDNRPGQGGSLALGELAKAPPDGSVMMLAHMSALCTNPHMYKSVPYNALRDFEAVGLVGDLPFVLVCHPALPFKNVQELIRYAKAEPDRLTNSSSGNGTVSHLAMEEFNRRAGVKIVHIPYKGSVPGLTDVVSGNVSIALETAAAVRPFVQGGKLRVLAAGTSSRLAELPDVPTLQEQGMGDFNAVTWLMLLYPRGVPKTLVQTTFEALRRELGNAEVEHKLLAANCLPRQSPSVDQANAYLRAEFQRWGEIVKRSGVSLD